ncbi:predicted protein [Streptomyces sp. SPB78]|uniref:hypothetical protein n=1 Tax=Streptomyces sp. (strain SPB78) TaxID=591157 RepID=UPI0001B56EA6|nr:hypothetical protein [Streptomyces sp. SPB78]EFL01615.1 predicted protein [Streptomyces sp. SPB78]
MNPIASLTTAAPGWTVSIDSPVGRGPVTAPVVAWVARSPETDPASMHVEPAFVVDGSVWTASEYDEIFGPITAITPPQQ